MSILVLVVMEPQRRSELVPMLATSEIQVLTVSSCQEACWIFEREPGVDVVITDLSHPDGNWSELLQWVVERSLPVSLVVSCAQADEGLWAEVLWRGAYDLLVGPYERSEVRRIVEGAARAAARLPRSAAQEG